MIPLLDVNVLVAIAWPNHTHHARARAWFMDIHANGWATTPATQAGFVRVSSNRTVIPAARSPSEAIALLADLITVAGHRFWDDAVGMTDGTLIAPQLIVGHRQVTDAHLFGIAVSHAGCLATFERGITDIVPEKLREEGRVMLVP